MTAPTRLSVKQLVRAFPLERLLDGGMDHADATALHAAARGGGDWFACADGLARDALARAEEALAAGRLVSAREWLLRASACWRYAQSPLPDADPRKRAAYTVLLDSFARAGALHEPPFERFELPWRGATVSGWLAWPAGGDPAPVVVVLGGVDAWREDYERSARQLRARRLGTLLLDMPGQGETRLFAGLPFDAGAFDLTSPLLDVLRAHPRCDGRIGVWGNSAGGWMALHMAARDARIGAVCVNGGTDRPTDILERFPRFIDRILLWTGREDGDEARALLDDLTLGAGTLAAVRCPVLMLHGEPDRVFAIDGARRIDALLPGAGPRLRAYPTGDHCLSSHAHERDLLVADWLAEALAPRRRATAA